MGEYYDKGIRLRLTVPCCNDDDDIKRQAIAIHHLRRQLLKTDSCELEIPELQFSSASGKAKFATLGEFLEEIEINLQHMSGGYNAIGGTTLAQLELMKQGKKKFTIMLDDPLGNSAIQVLPSHDGENNADLTYADDPLIHVEYYARSRLVNKMWDVPCEPWQVYTGDEGLKVCVELIKSKSNIVGFTGAGISVESGIPAFRSPNPDEKTIWNTYDMSGM